MFLDRKQQLSGTPYRYQQNHLENTLSKSAEQGKEAFMHPNNKRKTKTK